MIQSYTSRYHKDMDQIVIRTGKPFSMSRAAAGKEKNLWLTFQDDDTILLRTDSRPPLMPEIELSREDALKLAAAIYEKFPLDALGEIDP